MMRRLAIAAFASLSIAVAIPSPASAQATGSNDAVLKELQAIHELLKQLVVQTAPAPQQQPPAAQEPPKTAKLDSVRGYFLGRLDAPVTMVEFTDLQCPYCKMFHEFVFDKLKREYIDTGKVRFITRDNALPMHAYAPIAAMSSRCAGEQGKFWEVRRALQLNADKLDLALIKNTARDNGVEMTAYQQCMDSEKFLTDITEDGKAATAAGFTGTPAFVIGRTAANGLEGEVISGAQSWPTFEAALKALLDAAPSAKTK